MYHLFAGFDENGNPKFSTVAHWQEASSMVENTLKWYCDMTNYYKKLYLKEKIKNEKLRRKLKSE